MKINDSDTVFKTSDFTLATTLSLYFPIVAVDKIDSRRVEFSFQRSAKLGDIITQFWTYAIEVEPQKFVSQMKMIKTRIYSLL